MAKEVKSINVSPSAEESTINLWQSFGCEFKSTQEVKTQDVQVFDYQSSDGTKYYKTTKGEHYVKVTFERDKAMQNYAELVALEEAYYSKPEKPDDPVEPILNLPGRIPIFLILLSVAGFGLFFYFNSIIWVVAGAVFALITLIKILTHGGKCKEIRAEHETSMENYRKAKDEYPKKLKQYEEAVKMKREAISRAQALLE